MSDARLGSALGSFVRSPKGAFQTGAIVVGNVHTANMADKIFDVQVFDCASGPGFFPPTSPPLLSRVRSNAFNTEVPKETMTPPIPQDANGYYVITKINQIETPTGFTIDTSALPFGTAAPSCFDQNPTGIWLNMWDTPLPKVTNEDLFWFFTVWMWDFDTDWPAGDYKFTMEYVPRAPAP